MKKYLPWGLVAIPAIVFLMFLPAKFSGAPETQHIFSTIGAWFSSIGLSAIGEPLGSVGGYVIGAVELVAAILLIVPKTRAYGALLGAGILTGALFFHLFTPLGVAVNFPGESAGDPSLFVMAVVSWLCCIALIVMGRRPESAPAPA